MKIAITGAQGLLGEECMRTLGTEHTMLPLPSHRELDLVNFNATREWFLAAQPDVIIHTAANRDPDSCEKDPDLAWTSNTLVTYNVVNAARELDAVFVHASSDSVFPGDRDEPYHEFDEARDPINLYGYTKLASEKLVLQISAQTLQPSPAPALRPDWRAYPQQPVESPPCRPFRAEDGGRRRYLLFRLLCA